MEVNPAMEIVSIGYNHKHGKDFVIDRPDGTCSYLLLLIKTSAVFRMDGEESTISQNSFVLYEPFAPQYYRALDAFYINDYIHFFLNDNEKKILQAHDFPRNKPVHIAELKDISLLVRNMCGEFFSSNLFKDSSINAYFRIILNKLSERCVSKNCASFLHQGTHFEKLLWLRECIYRKPSDEWSIDKMAKEIFLSNSRFQHLYAETFGVGVKKDILHARIQYACTLLRSTDHPIDQISAMCGFESINYFFRKFKEIVGVTPRTYQKNSI